jgi:hypothetical protein
MGITDRTPPLIQSVGQTRVILVALCALSVSGLAFGLLGSAIDAGLGQLFLGYARAEDWASLSCAACCWANIVLDKPTSVSQRDSLNANRPTAVAGPVS